jgi:hypothetical protein
LETASELDNIRGIEGRLNATFYCWRLARSKKETGAGEAASKFFQEAREHLFSAIRMIYKFSNFDDPSLSDHKKRLRKNLVLYLRSLIDQFFQRKVKSEGDTGFDEWASSNRSRAANIDSIMGDDDSRGQRMRIFQDAGHFRFLAAEKALMDFSQAAREKDVDRMIFLSLRAIKELPSEFCPVAKKLEEYIGGGGRQAQELQELLAQTTDFLTKISKFDLGDLVSGRYARRLRNWMLGEIHNRAGGDRRIYLAVCIAVALVSAGIAAYFTPGLLVVSLGVGASIGGLVFTLLYHLSPFR